MKVYTETGMPVRLEQHPLGQGGEGKVFRVEGSPQAVAKIYTDPEDARSHRRKVEAMAHMSLPKTLSSRVAWPLGALYSDSAASDFVGFGMACIDERISLSDLYAFPPGPGLNFSVSDKLRVMESLASTVATLHAEGHVIGDFNEGNVGVVTGCEVAVHDTDSFHVSGEDGTLYRCPVCFPGWAAPEVLSAVHGYTYETCPSPTFTESSDDWALAVHVFKAIFNGIHPYHCAVDTSLVSGSVPAAVPIDSRIERGETPYFTRVAGCRVPAFSPDASVLPPYMRDAFERAFVAGHKEPSMRPSAKEWEDLVAQYRSDLTTCAHNGAHKYWSAVPACPYCTAERSFSLAKKNVTRRAARHMKPVPTSAGKAAVHASTPPAKAQAAGTRPAKHAGASGGRAGEVALSVLSVVGGILAVVVVVQVVIAALPGILCGAFIVAFIAGLCSS